MDMEDFGRNMVPTLVRMNTRNAIRVIKFMTKFNIRASEKGGHVTHVYPQSHEEKVVSHAEHVVAESHPHHSYVDYHHHGGHFGHSFPGAHFDRHHFGGHHGFGDLMGFE
jgi:hypothetical protein